MKTKPFTIRYFLIAIFAVCTLAFTSDAPMSQYVIPTSACSITSDDLDMDGDVDLVTGHNYNPQTQWSGLSIIQNTTNGLFSLTDSLFFLGGQSTLMCGQLDEIEKPEIIFREWITQQLIGVLYNNNLADTFFIHVNSTKPINYMDLGDVDGNGFTDLVLCSNIGKYWKIIYNHGYKNFTSSPFYSIPDYYPVDIACGDLNNDGRADVVICGQYVDVYLSTPSGFEKIYRDPDGIKNKLALCDFNLDGWMDILASADLLNTEWTNIYQNTGTGSFTKLEDYFLTPGATDFLIKDFNNDTLPDIAYLMYTSPGDTSGIKIAFNLGNFQISEPQHVNVPNLGESLRSFHSADLDGNGYNDFAVIRRMGIPAINLELLFNDGYGHFGTEPLVGFTKQPKQKQVLTSYPNPFVQSTTISYTLDAPGQVELMVYTINGQLISRLINCTQQAGQHALTWSKPEHITGTCIAILRVNGKIYQTLKLISL